MYYVKKIAALAATLMLVTVLSFFAFSVIPGDAAVLKLGTKVTDEQLEALRKDMGLDRNVVVRYGIWLKNAVHGDFGMSSYYTRPVSELIGEKLPVTLVLALISTAFMLLAIPLSVLTLKKENGVLDRVAVTLGRGVMAIPAFFLGILIMLLFGFVLGVFDVGGYVSFRQNVPAFLSYMLFPAIAVALPRTAQLYIFLRANLIKEMNSEYVRTLRAMGCSRWRVLTGHALKNAMLPAITFLGLVIAEVMAGSVIIEQVFNIPGLGRLLVQSIGVRDYNVTQAIVLYIGAAVIIINFAVDMLYRLFDPRLKSAD